MDLIFPEAEGRDWNEMSYGAQDMIAGVNEFVKVRWGGWLSVENKYSEYTTNLCSGT